MIQTYILHHTRRGDTVLDPFVGSGTTAREALILGRKAVVCDINPVAELITRGSILPVNFSALDAAFKRVEASVKERVLDIERLDIDEVAFRLAAENTQFLDRPIHPIVQRGARRGINLLRDLHNERQILGLLWIREAIDRESAPDLKLILKFVFSRSLKYASLMYSTGSKTYWRGDASPFRHLAYQVPSTPAYLNVWEIFARNFGSVRRVKKAFTEAVDGFCKEGETFFFLRGDAGELPLLLREAGLADHALADYCLTDPPYAEVVQYPLLFDLWYAWLGFERPDLRRDLTLVADAQPSQSPALVSEFVNRFSNAVTSISSVLRDRCWATLFYQHRNLAYWPPIMETAAAAGFEYRNVVPQPAQVPSFAKLKHPFATLAETMVVNFRKGRTVNLPRIENRVLFPNLHKFAELELQRLVVECLGADTETIAFHLISVLLDPSLMADRLTEAADLVDLLKANDLEPLGVEHGNRSEDLWMLKRGIDLDPAIDPFEQLRYRLFEHLRGVGAASKAAMDAVAVDVISGLTNSHRFPVRLDISEILREFAENRDGIWQYSPSIRREAVHPRLVLVRSSSPHLRPQLYGSRRGALRVRIDQLSDLALRYEARANPGEFARLRSLLLAALATIRDVFPDRVSRVHAVGELANGELDLAALTYSEIPLGVEVTESVGVSLFDLQRELANEVFAPVFLETGVMFAATLKPRDANWDWDDSTLTLLD